MKLICKKATLFFLVGIILAFCIGCNRTPATKSNEEIISDVAADKSFTDKYSDFSITEIEIIKRQTDIENKTDTIYVTLTVENDSRSIRGYIRPFYVRNILRKQVWMCPLHWC